jgi:hypothetical protein
MDRRAEYTSGQVMKAEMARKRPSKEQQMLYLALIHVFGETSYALICMQSTVVIGVT